MAERNDQASANETDCLVESHERVRRHVRSHVRFVDEEEQEVPDQRSTIEPSRLAQVWDRVCSYHITKAVMILGFLVCLSIGLLHSVRHDNERLMHRVCTSRTCLLASYELMSFLNESVDPCDDFYDFATGGWSAAHFPRDVNVSVYGIQQYMQEKNEHVLLSILHSHEIDSSTSRADQENLRKLRTYFDACIDTSAQDQQGAEPLMSLMGELAQILRMDHGNNTSAALAWLHAHGIDALFSTTIEEDAGLSPHFATPHVAPGGLGLSSPHMYKDNDAMAFYRRILSDALQALPPLHRWHMPTIAPVSSGDRERLVEQVLDFETRLAHIHPAIPASLADPLSTYHAMTTRELEFMAPGIRWQTYMHELSPSMLPHKVIVANTRYMVQLSELVQSTPTLTLHAYMYWSVIRDAGRYLGPHVPLGSPARQLHNFNAGLAYNATHPQVSTCVTSVTAALGYMAGRFFVEQAWDAQSQNAAMELVTSIRSAWHHSLSRISWLDAKTRERAQAKVQNLALNIGYPKRQPDSNDAEAVKKWYEDLPVASSYFLNEMASRMYRTRLAWMRLGGQVNSGGFGSLVTTDAEAEYHPKRHEAVFPAGLLQPPYFDREWPMYLQYGAAGTKVSHTLSHAFGPPGRFYDRNGILFDWWTPQTAHAYEEYVRCVETQAKQDRKEQKRLRKERKRQQKLQRHQERDEEKRKIRDDVYRQSISLQQPYVVHASSSTLHSTSVPRMLRNASAAETVADVHSLARSYEAWLDQLQKGDLAVYYRNLRLPGLQDYTHKQLFFIAFGSTWARSVLSGRASAQPGYRDQTDAHAPAAVKARVNAALVNFAPFADAFHCSPDKHAMARRTEERCDVG